MTLASAQPPGLIRVRGQLVVRRAGWLEPTARPQCPFGHDIHDHAVFLAGHGVVWCKYRVDKYTAECGALVFIAQIPHVGRFCADVTQEEMRTMQDEQLTAAQVFNYLGVHFMPGQLADRPDRRAVSVG